MSYDSIIVGAGSSGATLAVPRANTHLTCGMIGELMTDRLRANPHP